MVMNRVIWRIEEDEHLTYFMTDFIQSLSLAGSKMHAKWFRDLDLSESIWARPKDVPTSISFVTGRASKNLVVHMISWYTFLIGRIDGLNSCFREF